MSLRSEPTYAYASIDPLLRQNAAHLVEDRRRFRRPLDLGKRRC